MICFILSNMLIYTIMLMTILYVTSIKMFPTNILMSDSAIAVKWFKSNYMQANPDKFQALVLGSNKIKKLH